MTARVCTVLARAGSVGVPGKNVRLLGGIPLVAHSIRHARLTGLFDAIVVSTDDRSVRDIAAAEDVDVIVNRPGHLATSSAGKVPAIAHAVDVAERRLGRRFDVVVDLDATSPLRIPEDILAAVRLLERDAAATNVITGATARRSPYFNMVERASDGTVSLVRQSDPPILRRQDAPECFDMNASIYAWRRDALSADIAVITRGTRIHVMPESRSVDIDSELDWSIVTHLYALAALEQDKSGRSGAGGPHGS